MDLARAREYFDKKIGQADRSKCWVWQGPCSERMLNKRSLLNPIACVDGERLSARTLSWIVDGGLPSDGPFRTTCGNGLCVNPDHLEPCRRGPGPGERDFVERLSDGFFLLGLSEDDDGE